MSQQAKETQPAVLCLHSTAVCSLACSNMVLLEANSVSTLQLDGSEAGSTMDWLKQRKLWRKVTMSP